MHYTQRRFLGRLQNVDYDNEFQIIFFFSFDESFKFLEEAFAFSKRCFKTKKASSFDHISHQCAFVARVRRARLRETKLPSSVQKKNILLNCLNIASSTSDRANCR